MAWEIAKGIVLAVFILVGLFAALAAVMWAGLGIMCLIAMIGQLLQRLAQPKPPKPLATPPPIQTLTPRQERRIVLRKRYADRINFGDEK